MNTTTTKRPFLSALLLLVAMASSQAAVTVYDSLSTSATAGYSEPNGGNPIFGDSLNLIQGGTLGVFGVSIYNGSAGGNIGSILTGTMVVKFYDNTIPYGGGVLNKPLLGTATLNWDFTVGGGLAPGFYTTQTFDLSALNIILPPNILVTQQFTETSGTSGRNGVVLFSTPAVGSSPNTVYIKSSGTAEGLYTFSGNAGQFGYSIEVTNPPAGNQQPVANAQSVSLIKNGTASITLTATDIDGDPLTYNIVSPPTNGILSGSAPNVVYQPNADYVGPDAFTFKANDGLTDSAPAVVSISVVNSAGLIIVPIFDSTITSDPNAAIIENTINSAILVYESKFSDPVTVTITFREKGSGLGSSSTYIGVIAYSSFFSALTADSKTTNDTIVLAHLPGGPNNPVDGTANIRLTTANFRALGFTANPPAGQPDSTISLNVSICNLTRTSIDPSKYDLMAVASHEIDEALGSGSGLGGANVAVPDLFRYAPGGVRNYTTSGDNAYFSIDGTTDLARYNQDPSGDKGDWWSVGPHSPVRVQDALGTPGTTPDLGVELTVLDAIGWDLVTTVPAPPPVFRPVTRSGNTIQFTWSSVATRTYQLQFKTNLTQPSWNNLGSPIPATGATTSSSDSIGPDPQRYYRVALLPGPIAPPPVSNHAQAGVISPLTLTTNYFLPSPQAIGTGPRSQSEPRPLNELPSLAQPQR